MFLWYFARPGQMEGHTYTDDVAVTRAWSKKGAVKKFRQLYTFEDSDVGTIWRIRPSRYCNGVQVLTDY